MWCVARGWLNRGQVVPGEVVKISNGVEDEGGPAVAIKFMHPLILRVRGCFRFSIRSTESRRDKIASRNGTPSKFVIDLKFDAISKVPKESEV